MNDWSSWPHCRRKTFLAGAFLVFCSAPGLLLYAGDDMSSVPRISVEELSKLMTTGGVLLVDVRDEPYYDRGHIPGAVSLPIGVFAERALELRDTKKPIVTYCS